MEAGSKDRPPMLAPGNYIQWKSRIKRYIDTKPNHELIHIYLMNPSYELGWKEKFALDSEGNPTTATQKQSQELKNVSYHKLYDILKQHQHEVNEIRAEKIARVANPLALVAQQQQVYHPQTHSTHYNQNSSTRTSQATTRNRGKALVNSLKPIYFRNLENSRHRMSQELKTISYHKLYDILKQHQHEVNEIRAKKIARVANPLALVALQQPVYHPQTHPTHYNQNFSTRSQQAATKNRGKAIVKSP
nr:hypothetical protein [Tanacetum cinerariifolium]